VAKKLGSRERSAYQPDRGHFVYLDFTPQAGTEQAGRRPALILSPLSFNIATGLALVCPVTNQLKGGAFEVPIPPTVRTTGAVLSDHIRSVDWIARNATFLSHAPTDLIREVLGRIEAILALSLDH
jgi:mRNA interferase MazF